MKEKLNRFGKWAAGQGERLAAVPLRERIHTALVAGVLFAALFYMGGYGSATAYGANALNINSAVITNGLFEGANIIIGALGAVVFLLIGFTFGAKILSAIGAFVQRISF